MEVIVQEAIGMHLPTGLLTSFPESLEELPLVLIIHEDSFAPIPSAHHVIYRSRILHPQLPRHFQKLPLCRTNRQGRSRILRDPFHSRLRFATINHRFAIEITGRPKE